MAEDKKKTTTDAAVAEKKPEKAVEPKKPAPKPPAKPEPKATLPKQAAVPRRKRFKGKAKSKRVLVSALASATKTPAIVMVGIRAAYGWTRKTKMTKSDFLRKRDEWLARPASEV